MPAQWTRNPRTTSYQLPALVGLAAEGCHVGNASQELLDQHVLPTSKRKPEKQHLRKTWLFPPLPKKRVFKRMQNDHNAYLQFFCWLFVGCLVESCSLIFRGDATSCFAFKKMTSLFFIFFVGFFHRRALFKLGVPLNATTNGFNIQLLWHIQHCSAENGGVLEDILHLLSKPWNTASHAHLRRFFFLLYDGNPPLKSWFVFQEKWTNKRNRIAKKTIAGLFFRIGSKRIGANHPHLVPHVLVI